jgi:hypothetical protein
MALAFLLTCGTGAWAAPLAGDAVPQVLEEWKSWVLHGQKAWFCPEVAGERDEEFCAWPGELRLQAEEKAARFAQVWEMQREGPAALPGSREHWPEQVTVDGEAHPVLARDGAPVVWLPSGRHEVNGLISWTERPRTLDIPRKVALLALTVDGRGVLPERHGAALVLGDAGIPAREEDSLDVQVYRKLDDGIPARLITLVRFKVSGKARELGVPDVLPARFVPVRIVSPWTVRLDQDGRLEVQAMPGQAVVEIEARLDGPLQEIEPGLPPERPQEVWSYQDAPALRATTITPDNERVIAVDPRQAGVPGEWSALPAFVLNEGARLRVEERSRGQSERENQRLMLQREMWLDFSGAGFFARDRIEGAMRQGWRFDVARPYTLERADGLADSAGQRALSEMAAALLVTRGASDDLTGVEWRQPRVTLNAGVRLAADANARIPVTGWRQSFDSVDATLHLPYGYRLVAAPGADRVSSNVWVERWTILDVFLAAFFALLSWRLFGAAGGLAAAVYLALAMHESLAPVQSFAAAVVLALLRRAVPEGRLRRWLLAGERLALLCLVLMAAVFLPAQMRYALHPQLEEDAPAIVPRFAAQADLGDVRDDAAIEMKAELSEHSPAASAFNAASSVARARVPGKAGSGSSAVRQRYAQSTVTQTGGGEPAWNIGERYRLHWSGPVAETQSVRLLISPHWLTRCLRVLMAALLGFLLWRLTRAAFPGSASPSSKARAAPVLPLACLAVLLAAFPVPAAASGFPSAQLLDELKNRLLEAPECAPDCVDAAEARIDADGSALRVALTAHVEQASSLALPEPDEHSFLRAARVDGEARPVLRFHERNYVALPRGIHRVELEYAVNGDTAALNFPVRPARIEFAGAGWQVEGIDQNRLLSETLNFSRLPAPASPAGAGTDAADAPPERVAQAFPPFVQVTRRLDLDLDWSVHTQVARIAPAEGGFTFPVPLLPGEHVTSPEVKVQDGRALAVFSAGAGAVSWSARLDKTRTIELAAPPLSERAEIWRVSVSPSWHLDWSGVPVTLSGDAEELVFEFHPLPGEKLTLTPTQPRKTDGGSRAIDRVRLESSVGQHAREHTLQFWLRASQAGEQRIALPAGLEALDVRRDGAPLNLQARENQISLPVSPGGHGYALRLREQREIGWSTTSPAIDLGLPMANVDLRAALSEQRWVLAVRGPAVGPAVLYWGELAVALLVALLLAKSGWSSLRPWQWFLLVLGFSTFSWTALLLFALWLLVIDWRVRAVACADWPARKFNAMQAGIVALTAAVLSALIDSVATGLLSVPGMGIRGYRSGAGNLNWFADQSGPQLPVVEIFSLPILVYRVLMLAWALWLAYVLIRCLARGLAAWLGNGYWKKTGGIWRRSKHPEKEGDERRV